LERIEAFERDGKQIIYFNLCDIKSNEELSEVVEQAKEAINGYGQQQCVYTITNISRIAFDTRTKEIAADWMAFNKPFVINAAFIGVTGVRKIMMNAVFLLSGRTNVKLFHDMEQATQWIDSL